MTEPLRVLLCDDSVTFAALLEAWIAGDDRLTHVGTANSGNALVELAERVDADVLVLDLVLPDVDDTAELVAQVRRHRPDIRVLLLSSLPPDELEEVAGRAEADGFSHKLITAEQLRDAVAAAAT